MRSHPRFIPVLLDGFGNMTGRRRRRENDVMYLAFWQIVLCSQQLTTAFKSVQQCFNKADLDKLLTTPEQLITAQRSYINTLRTVLN